MRRINVFQKSRNLPGYVCQFIPGVISMVYSNTMPVFAEIPDVHVPASSSTTDLVGEMGGLMLKIAEYGGTVVMLWGAVMFAFSLKNDDPDSKQRGLMCFVTGIVLFFLRGFLVGAGVITG